jgi:DNA-binding NarL/FixJ family response regulator
VAPTPPRRQPTRRQAEVLRAYIATGSIAAAAYELGISETTARQHLSGLYRRTGCLNAAQAAYLLGTRQLDSDATPRCRWTRPWRYSVAATASGVMT